MTLLTIMTTSSYANSIRCSTYSDWQNFSILIKSTDSGIYSAKIDMITPMYARYSGNVGYEDEKPILKGNLISEGTGTVNKVSVYMEHFDENKDFIAWLVLEGEYGRFARTIYCSPQL